MTDSRTAMEELDRLEREEFARLAELHTMTTDEMIEAVKEKYRKPYMDIVLPTQPHETLKY